MSGGPGPPAAPPGRELSPALADRPDRARPTAAVHPLGAALNPPSPRPLRDDPGRGLSGIPRHPGDPPELAPGGRLGGRPGRPCPPPDERPPGPRPRGRRVPEVRIACLGDPEDRRGLRPSGASRLAHQRSAPVPASASASRGDGLKGSSEHRPFQPAGSARSSSSTSPKSEPSSARWLWGRSSTPSQGRRASRTSVSAWTALGSREKTRRVDDGNLARLDRFWKTLKAEYARGLFLYRPLRALERDLRRYVRWYNTERPSWPLGGRAPSDRGLPRLQRLETGRLEVGRFEVTAGCRSSASAGRPDSVLWHPISAVRGNPQSGGLSLLSSLPKTELDSYGRSQSLPGPWGHKPARAYILYRNHATGFQRAFWAQWASGRRRENVGLSTSVNLRNASVLIPGRVTIIPAISGTYLSL